MPTQPLRCTLKSLLCEVFFDSYCCFILWFLWTLVRTGGIATCNYPTEDNYPSVGSFSHFKPYFLTRQDDLDLFKFACHLRAEKMNRCSMFVTQWKSEKNNTVIIYTFIYKTKTTYHPVWTPHHIFCFSSELLALLPSMAKVLQSQEVSWWFCYNWRARLFLSVSRK